MGRLASLTPPVALIALGGAISGDPAQAPVQNPILVDAGPMDRTPGLYCRPFPADRVQAAPGGFLLLDRDGRHDGRVVPQADRPSPDRQFWICQRAGEPVGWVFAPGRPGES